MQISSTKRFHDSICIAELGEMILNAGIIILPREYFNSGLPRSRWNYICNRLTGEKDVKDKEGWRGEDRVGKESLQIVKGDQKKECVD